jgi:FkbM family methyltransferase
VTLLSSAAAFARRRARGWVLRRVRARPELGLEKVGTAYGGWVVPTRLMDATWRCYCGGVGEDASFDLGIIERFGCSVFAFDPTPRAIAFADGIAAGEPRFRFMPVGLWSSDTTLRFYRPRNPEHVSHSVVNLQGTSEWFEAPCRSVPSLMTELGHPTIDLLKVDIEGAEHAVIPSVLDAGIRPRVVCFEVDQPVGPLRFLRTIRHVLGAGYDLVAVDGWNFTFVRQDVGAAEAAGTSVASAEHRESERAAGTDPRITFGVIVLNGEPFTRYTLRSLYPFAHEIIVVEGAAPAAHNIATADGHSRDGTLAELRRFKAEEDPDGKVTIVTAEDDGHGDGWWQGEKDEQSRAYAKRATGDYLWQVDIDEFYRAEEMGRVIDMLRDDPTITAVTFKQLTFWGGLAYRTDGWYLRRGATYYHRLFRWRPGYEYATHRPPTVRDSGGRDLRDGHWIRGEDLARQGIHLYHYSLLLPKQVIEKCDYYGNVTWTNRPGAVAWAQDAFLWLGRPYRVHNVYDFPSWLERYHGPHPEEVTRMVEELARDRPDELRDSADIEHLLGSWWYPIGRQLLILLEPVDRRVQAVQRPLARTGRRTVRRAGRLARRALRKAVRVARRVAGVRPSPS